MSLSTPVPPQCAATSDSSSGWSRGPRSGARNPPDAQDCDRRNRDQAIPPARKPDRARERESIERAELLEPRGASQLTQPRISRNSRTSGMGIPSAHSSTAIRTLPDRIPPSLDRVVRDSVGTWFMETGPFTDAVQTTGVPKLTLPETDDRHTPPVGPSGEWPNAHRVESDEASTRGALCRAP